ncbi:MAG: hypothetical protein AAF266_13915 [Planctomycetota bacterium]
MPRTGIKPFFRKQTRSYYCEIDGKQIALGRDKRAAEAKCQQLLDDQAARKAALTTVRELLARYLEWCEKHRSRSTYYSAQYYLRLFARAIPARMRVEEVRPQHVIDWIDASETWNDSSKHDAVTIVQRAFSWAEGEQLIDYHPLRRIGPNLSSAHSSSSGESISITVTRSVISAKLPIRAPKQASRRSGSSGGVFCQSRSNGRLPPVAIGRTRHPSAW